MSKERKERIQQRINAFATGRFADNAFALFKELGYESNKRITLDKGTFEGLFAELSGANKQKAFFDDWLSADYLFQLTEDEISRQKSLFSVNKYNPNEYQSYSFVAIELRNEQYPRGKLSQITREVNKLFPMPVMILFKHGNTLSLSIIDRRPNERDISKDVLKKVTLIKDIRISPAGGGVRRTGVEIPLNKGGEGVVTHRAHIEILFDLSFDELKNKHGFTNFVEMHNAWQKTLDTRELNKRFFKELANWYFWATQKVEFPDDAEKKQEVRNATSVIRLITRLIFVWFLKEKGLVPDELFDEKQLKKLLKYTDNKKSTYYKAILQNLFFATLNTEMGNRRFRIKNDSGRDGHYFIHNVFRYETEFVKPKETLEQYFAPIPFLNGGLFECLDKELDDKGKLKRIRIDGFSDRVENVLEVPDELFFNEKGVDVNLSEIYGSPKRSKEKVRGLIDILNSYKFTVTENTPIEEEIALDPELLGKVFENLLANYNPETQTTARKQTGSFNTPRDIVNYMVDESLLAYLKQKLEEAGYKDTEPRLRELLSYSENPNPFNAKETAVLIKAIDSCKILDPACGSGAFPMGILHKMVYILHKLDPNNAHWKQRQLDKVDKLIEEAEGISDTRVREKVIEDLHDTRRDIEEAFDNNELDYGRKLYLIENCIYGVDIQPIAVQIAKLRFFISLIVDQKVNPNRDNLGIRPLPNLETKFVAANTLIGLEKEQANLFTNPNIEKKKAELKKVRHDYFEARTPKRKENCRIKDKQMRDELAELLIQNHDFQPATAKKIAAWDPYDQNASSPFFDPEWMFGIKGGFDVVIGNPPYVQIQNFSGMQQQQKDWEKQKYETYAKTGDVYCLFYERGYRLLKDGGVLAFITSNKWMRANYGRVMR
ncbi:MAG TPA: Eco57I restriction-modification methylase domain-containing protein, partial [Candidatus Wunengus sp. YC61]|uniref:Eco57I restriction-modification methylase domain-containing protein n=1 Tax=Candidatus Wunengus sp. YC61 TaxID=3367698 RepID=UPI00402900F3